MKKYIIIDDRQEVTGMSNNNSSSTDKRNTRLRNRKLQDIIDYSIRRYDGLGRVISRSLRDTVRSARSFERHNSGGVRKRRGRGIDSMHLKT